MRLITSILLSLSLLVSSASADWKLTFGDEFTTPGSPDTQKWDNGYLLPWSWGVISLPGNGEQQCWTPSNATVYQGVLYLIGKKQTIQCGKPGTLFKTFYYTSGAVTSYTHFKQLYGYFEIKAQVPKGQGVWAAFWLVSDNLVWPPEVDIFEIIDSASTIDHQTFHYLDANGVHQMDGGQTTITDANANWHVYGLDWQADHITWYVDGKATKTVTHNIPNTPMYPQMTLSLGGYWPGMIDSTTKFPLYFKIDYLHVYAKLPNTPSTPIPFGK